MTIEPSVRPTPTGILLDIEVVPNASASKFPAGWNAWRKRVEARVAAPANEGRANEELVRLVAAFFDRPTRDVHVVAGATSRQKRLSIEGVGVAAAIAALEAKL